MTKYLVIDRHTGVVVGTYATIERARAKRDKLDLEYGAIRYGIRELFPNGYERAR